jgi:phage terminase small subunit
MLRKPELPPKPSKHLSKAASAWWVHVLDSFELEEHHLHLLKLACECLDRAETARIALSEQGTVYVDRFNCPRARPEVAQLRDATTQFAKLSRALDLDSAPPGAPGPRQPPSVRRA